MASRVIGVRLHITDRQCFDLESRVAERIGALLERGSLEEVFCFPFHARAIADGVLLTLMK
jgi:hypothetical protein